MIASYLSLMTPLREWLAVRAPVRVSAHANAPVTSALSCPGSAGQTGGSSPPAFMHRRMYTHTLAPYVFREAKGRGAWVRAPPPAQSVLSLLPYVLWKPV